MGKNKRKRERKQLDLEKKYKVGKITTLLKLLDNTSGVNILFMTNLGYMCLPVSRKFLLKWPEHITNQRVKILYNWVNKPHNSIHIKLLKPKQKSNKRRL